METKSLLYGLIGFFLGGLIVSIAATTLTSRAISQPTMNECIQASNEALGKKSNDDLNKTTTHCTDDTR